MKAGAQRIRGTRAEHEPDATRKHRDLDWGPRNVGADVGGGGAREGEGGEETFLRRPEVPGFWPSKGVVAFFVTVKSPMAGPLTIRCLSPREAMRGVARRGRWRWRDREGVVVLVVW